MEKPTPPSNQTIQEGHDPEQKKVDREKLQQSIDQKNKAVKEQQIIKK